MVAVMLASGLGMFMTAAWAAKPVPERISETYDAWVLNCRSLKAEAKSRKAGQKEKKPAEASARKGDDKARIVCEISQVYTNKRSRREVARFVLALDGQSGNNGKGAKSAKSAKGGRKGGYVGVLRVLVDVSFSRKPVVVADGVNLLNGDFTHCFNRFCYARFAGITEDQLRKMQQAEKLAIRYQLARGLLLSINMQPKGLLDALAAMKERQQ